MLVCEYCGNNNFRVELTFHTDTADKLRGEFLLKLLGVVAFAVCLPSTWCRSLISKHVVYTSCISEYFLLTPLSCWISLVSSDVFVRLKLLAAARQTEILYLQRCGLWVVAGQSRATRPPCVAAFYIRFMSQMQISKNSAWSCVLSFVSGVQSRLPN